MIILKGKGVCAGIVSGKLFFYKQIIENEVKKISVDNKAEIERLYRAKDEAIKELEKLYEDSRVKLGEENAQIFQIHSMMLEDDEFVDYMVDAIGTQNINAEYAVSLASAFFVKMLTDTADGYISERTADVKDVSARLIALLSGTSTQKMTLPFPVIVAALDLVPSETAQLDRSKVLALLTMQGTSNSHTAIIARGLNIPAVVSLGDSLSTSYDGREVIVDGLSGVVYIDPDEKTVKEFALKAAQCNNDFELLLNLKGAQNTTIDGHTVEVFANIGNEKEVSAALENDAGGIGLLRSEFLYLEKNSFPSEEELFSSYRSIAVQMGGRKVIIRTLDIGADKQAPYFNLAKEQNPAMGMRAIRICLTQPELFIIQLRAILRASAFGKIAIMFPMIISVEEIRKSRILLEAAKKELSEKKIDFDRTIECGIMIETPAAALISNVLAKEVDFFSIGSNDLTQYTLAIDRQNTALDDFYNPHHEAVLKLIEMTVDNAHANGIWVGICGELGADLTLTKRFLQMGMDEFSVSPSSVLLLRKKIRETGLTE